MSLLRFDGGVCGQSSIIVSTVEHAVGVVCNSTLFDDRDGVTGSLPLESSRQGFLDSSRSGRMPPTGGNGVLALLG
jgi:hypothetical protein